MPLNCDHLTKLHDSQKVGPDLDLDAEKTGVEEFGAGPQRKNFRLSVNPSRNQELTFP